MSHPFDKLALSDGANFIFTPCPGTKQADLNESLTALKEAGTTAVLTMLSNSEIESLGVSELGQQTQALGMKWFQLPVVDGCAPEAAFEDAFQSCKQTLLNLIKSGETLAIHCRGGTGRTGLMAAILLLESGEKWQHVLPLIQSIRPKALTLSSHIDYLKAHYLID